MEGDGLSTRDLAAKIDRNGSQPVDLDFRAYKHGALRIKLDVDSRSTGSRRDAGLPGVRAFRYKSLGHQAGDDVAGRRAVETQRSRQIGPTHRALAKEDVEGAQLIQVAHRLWRAPYRCEFGSALVLVHRARIFASGSFARRGVFKRGPAVRHLEKSPIYQYP